MICSVFCLKRKNLPQRMGHDRKNSANELQWPTLQPIYIWTYVVYKHRYAAFLVMKIPVIMLINFVVIFHLIYVKLENLEQMRACVRRAPQLARDFYENRWMRSEQYEKETHAINNRNVWVSAVSDLRLTCVCVLNASWPLLRYKLHLV